MFKSIRKQWQKIKNRIARYRYLAIKYPRIYRKYSKQEVDENKVLFIEPKHGSFSNNFQYLYDELSSNYSFDIHIHLLKEFFVSDEEHRERCIAMIKDLATAKYVFIDEACNVIGRVKIRKETYIAQTWHACGAFKKFGFSTAELRFGVTKREMEKYPYYKYCDMVAISSPEIRWVYSEAMGLPEEKILPIGVSRTDAFFDDDFISSAKKKLEYFMPNSKGKKVILFAPTFRGRVRKAASSKAFMVDRFYEALSDKYVLIMKHHPYVQKRPKIPAEYQDFAVDFTNTMTIEELLCVADICISDYSSLVFEYSLFEKPMIFFNYDIDEYFDWRGFYYNYDEMTPGPKFQRNKDMIDYIEHIDERFDKQQVIDFKNKFMSSCDGHSTERIMEKVFGEALEAKRLSEPVKWKADAVLSGPDKEDFKLLDDDKIRAAKERFVQEYQSAAGKKIIGYFPTEREDKGSPDINPYIDWLPFYEDLNDDHIVAYVGKLPKGKNPNKFMNTRFIECGEVLSRSELASIADIVITDFDYQVGITCADVKPTLLYLPDYRYYCANEEDYKVSTNSLRDGGLMYENTKDLAVGLNENKQCNKMCFAEAYMNIYIHFKR